MILSMLKFQFWMNIGPIRSTLAAACICGYFLGSENSLGSVLLVESFAVSGHALRVPFLSQHRGEA